MNYMVWNRAAAAEYDVWEALGSAGWNWASVLAGMARSENFTRVAPGDYGSPGWGRGTEGPIQNVVSRYRTEQVLAWVPTMAKLGIAQNLESLGGEPLGAMLQSASYNPDNYTRSYSANAYLLRAGVNLHLLLSTRVAKVNFEGESNHTGRAHSSSSSQHELVATGVTLQDGTVIHAQKEVILSAGSIQSPGLLELSGIGQKSVLDAAGITQILDLPGVGENLQGKSLVTAQALSSPHTPPNTRPPPPLDHIGFPVTFQLKPGYHSLDSLRYNSTYAAEQLALWEASQVSRYDSTGLHAIAFLTWPQLTAASAHLVALAQAALGQSTNVIDRAKLAFLSNPSVPQLELIFTDGSLNGYPLAPADPRYGTADFVTISAIAMRPLSRGYVHVASADIDRAPVIDPRYLASEYDLQSLVAAGRYIRRIAATAPLAGFLAGEQAPGEAAGDSDEAWAKYVREVSFSIYHYAGTCAMLPREDGGVVDARLRVHGTRGLRVVDVSITPVLIGSHTQTVAYGIAERAAEIIVEDYEAA